jgi:hypothetical protein
MAKATIGDTQQAWTAFRRAGLLWFVNRILHVFGWAIIVEIGTEHPVEGEVVCAYPKRVGWRGFSEHEEGEGFAAVSKYLVDLSPQLSKEATALREEA